MGAPKERKINRDHILQDIIKMIQESGQVEVEVSSSELADRYGVQAPTMDYHLDKLVKQGKIIVSDERGRYNRKKYRVPGALKKATAEVHVPFKNEDSQKKFDEFLRNHLNKSNPVVQEVAKEPAPVVEEKVEMEEIVPEVIEELDVPVQEETLEDPVQELTLDDRIKQFLRDSSQVHDANVLLGHEDREILSVVNETIQQNIVYLKDLSEQLSTVQNKQLIQHLIDDRNSMQEQINRLTKERDDALAAASKVKQSHSVDPKRIRFMQQVLTDTVDQYVKLSNHAMALSRNDFRNKISKEIRDLSNYALNIDK